MLGQQKIHIEEVQEPIPVLQQRTATNTWESLRNIEPRGRPIPPIMNDPTTNPDVLEPPGLTETQFRGFNFNYLDFLNRHDVFCELWIAKCILVGFCARCILLCNVSILILLVAAPTSY